MELPDSGGTVAVSKLLSGSRGRHTLRAGRTFQSRSCGALATGNERTRSRVRDVRAQRASNRLATQSRPTKRKALHSADGRPWARKSSRARWVARSGSRPSARARWKAAAKLSAVESETGHNVRTRLRVPDSRNARATPRRPSASTGRPPALSQAVSNAVCRVGAKSATCSAHKISRRLERTRPFGCEAARCAGFRAREVSRHVQVAARPQLALERLLVEPSAPSKTGRVGDRRQGRLELAPRSGQFGSDTWRSGHRR